MLPLTAEQSRRRWLALGVVALSYVLSFFQRFAPAGIAQDLAAAFQTSAASLGVAKSGSPAVRLMMSRPSALSRAARAVAAMVGEGLTRCTRRESGIDTAGYSACFGAGGNQVRGL